jgi:hypothetical protein
VESIRSELARVDFESIRTDKGPNSQSITLSGHSTVTEGASAVTLTGVTYRSLQADGKLRYRCAKPDFWLRPGQTAIYGSDSFTVGEISLNISSRTQSMEVAQA